MKDVTTCSPLRILQTSSHKELGRGNIGVVMARAGVGKTACLIHIALHKLFQRERLVHVSLDDTPEKITSYYKVILADLVKALDVGSEERQGMNTLIERNKMILVYLNQSFQIERLRENLKNLQEKIGFIPNTLIVDGLDFEKAGVDLFKGFKEIAREARVEIWFSALAHRHIKEVNERGIPFPCSHVDDLFSIIMQMEPTPSHITLKLLKDHGSPVTAEDSVKLDPNTCLALA